MDSRTVAPPGGVVPCNGCTRCCRNWDLLRLLPADNPDQYKTEPHPIIKGDVMLAHKPNGDCYYLGEGGCTIHERRPLMCREMDCRNIARRLTYTKARKLKNMLPIWRRGRELLRLEK